MSSANNEKGYDKIFTSSSGKKYKLFIQNNYPYDAYWPESYSKTIAGAGCGPTSAAIILSGLGTNDTPVTVAQYNAMGLITGEQYFFTSRGFKAQYQYVDWQSNAYQNNQNWQKIINHLKAGNAMVVNINCATKVYLNGEGYDGHYITFLDYNPEKDEIFIGDPWRTPGCQGGTGWYSLSYLKTIQYAFPWVVYVYQ